MTSGSRGVDDRRRCFAVDDLTRSRLIRRREQIVFSNDGARLGVADDVLDLAAAIENVDRHEDHAELHAGDEDVDQLDAIREIDAKAVAFLKSAIAQCIRHAVAARLDLAECELASIPLQTDLVAPAKEREVEKI